MSSYNVQVVLLIIFLIVPDGCGEKCGDEIGNNTKKISQEFTRGMKHFIAFWNRQSNFILPTICFSTLAITSVISNSLIIHVVRVNLHMRTTTNYFIVNMACGDLLLTICMAAVFFKKVIIGLEWSEGTFGIIACRVVHVTVFSSAFCSMFSLVAITFDRFMAVSRPITYKYSSWWTKYIIPAVWIACAGVPFLFGFQATPLEEYDFLQSGHCKTYCFLPEASKIKILIVSTTYFVPHVVMVILYSMIAYKLWTRRVPGDQRDPQRQNAAQQTAKKVTRMIVSVLLAFEFCWAPKYISWIVPYVDPGVYYSNDYYLLTEIGGIVMTSNGLLNALIYAKFNQNYRQAFKSALGIQRLCGWCRTFRKKLQRNSSTVEEA